MEVSTLLEILVVNFLNAWYLDRRVRPFQPFLRFYST